MEYFFFKVIKHKNVITILDSKCKHRNANVHPSQHLIDTPSIEMVFETQLMFPLARSH